MSISGADTDRHVFMHLLLSYNNIREPSQIHIRLKGSQSYVES